MPFAYLKPQQLLIAGGRRGSSARRAATYSRGDGCRSRRRLNRRWTDRRCGSFYRLFM